MADVNKDRQQLDRSMDQREFRVFSDDKQMHKLMKDMLLNADRVLRNASDELRAEDSDGTFLSSHRHQKQPQLHSHLAQTVREHMSSYVQREISRAQERLDHPETHASLVEACCRNLMESSEYQAFKKDICSSVEQATHQFTLDYFSGAQELPDEVLEDGKWVFSGHGANSVTDGDTSSLTSSYGAAYWEMLNPSRLGELAHRLGEENLPEVRAEALRTLSALPVAEVVAFDTWPLVKRQLESLLMAPEAEIFDAALHLHAKMLRSASSFCVVEGYDVLVRAFRGAFRGAPLSGIDRRLLRLGKLINTFQRVVPRYWTRFPERHARAVVEVSVRCLLDDTSDGAEELTPLHVLALVDPHARWLDAWTKGEYGRRLVLAELASNRRVLPHLLGRCLLNFEIISSCREPASGETQLKAPSVGDEASLVRVPPAYVEYCCLFQAVGMLGLLLQSAGGRSLFDSLAGSIQAKDFAVRMIQAMVDVAKATDACNEFCLGTLVAGIVGGLTAQESSCQYFFSNDELTRAIFEPLGGFREAYDMSGEELHLLGHVADVLLPLTETVVGLALVLECPNSNENFVVPLAQFTERLLLVAEDAVPSSCQTLEDLKSKYVKICCRVFSSHAGIGALNRTGLLHKIAEEWEALLRRCERTPVPGAPKIDGRLRDRARDWLAELGAIGCTPLGLAALHKADLLHDILGWAEREVTEGEQLNCLPVQTRLMLSQAATACNHQLGLAHHIAPVVESTAETIYQACERRHVPGTGSGILPTSDERLEMFLTQGLADMACILPSCAAMTSLLPAGFSADTEDGTPAIPSLVKLVAAGVRDTLGGAETMCEMGLRLLAVLSTSLDTWLQLQCRYNLLELLLEAQQANVLEDSAQVVVDNLFLLRNYLLVKIAVIGGESEKVLPPYVVEQDSLDMEFLHQWPLIVELPIPPKYMPALTSLGSPPLEIERFLKESQLENLDQDWLIYCREVYRNCLTSGSVQLRSQWFGNLLSNAVEAMVRKSGQRASVSEMDSPTAKVQNLHKPSEISTILRIGSQFVIGYGLRLGLLDNEAVATDDLLRVLLAFHGDKEQEFDWILATAFLLTCGNAERTIKFRRQMRAVPVEAQMTSCRTQTPRDLSSSPWLTFCHNVEVVLSGDLPLVAHALQLSGISVGQICQPWISQCFWNILDWEEICNYFGLCLLCGEDFLVYYVVALFRHLQTEIVHRARDGNASIFLRETRLEGFSTRDYLPFMDHLESKYHDVLVRTPDHERS